MGIGPVPHLTISSLVLKGVWIGESFVSVRNGFCSEGCGGWKKQICGIMQKLCSHLFGDQKSVIFHKQSIQLCN